MDNPNTPTMLTGLNEEERALVRAALICAEGHWNTKGNCAPRFSEASEHHFKLADSFRELFDKLVGEVPVVEGAGS